MRVLECYEPNDNTHFFGEILKGLNIDEAKYKWVISDLNLIPIFHGDYSGIGGKEPQGIAYHFMERVEREKAVIVDINEMYNILEDTQSIRNGVFICLSRQDDIDIRTYHPKVECDCTDQLYDERAKCEVRILDGSLFFILY